MNPLALNRLLREMTDTERQAVLGVSMILLGLSALAGMFLFWR
ncbi:MAG: hypothetical protein RLZZ403_1418 [Pseudomonadota bacterium]|jgi:hypothetical protein